MGKEIDTNMVPFTDENGDVSQEVADAMLKGMPIIGMGKVGESWGKMRVFIPDEDLYDEMIEKNK